MEITLVKAAGPGDRDRAYLKDGDGARRGPIHVVHDLPHLVVGSLFGITDGLWGELASGFRAAAGHAASARYPKRQKQGRIVSGPPPTTRPAWRCRPSSARAGQPGRGRRAARSHPPADAAVGRIAAAFRGSARAGDVVLGFAADHGLAMPGAKCTLFDPGLEIIVAGFMRFFAFTRFGLCVGSSPSDLLSFSTGSSASRARNVCPVSNVTRRTGFPPSAWDGDRY
jgi:hypothetical protein